MKQKSIEFAAFMLFLLPLLIILASPTFSSKALGLDDVTAQSEEGIVRQKFYGLGGKYDGWILESGYQTGVGGSMNYTTPTMPVGDNAQNRAYRGILTFDTAPLPATALVDDLYLT